MKKYLHKAKKHHFIAIAVVGVLLVAGLFVAGNAVISSKTKHGSSLTNVLGLTASNNYYDLEVSGVSVGPVNQVSSTKRATVTLTLGNNSNEILQVSPGLQMFLVGSDGKIYPMTARYLAAGTSLGGPLASNGSMTINVDYDIPANVSPKTFTYQPDSSKPTANIGL